MQQSIASVWMKVRGEKLENWREKEKLKADKRAEDRELLGRKSSEMLLCVSISIHVPLCQCS
uniref:Uncharacterized protein n=1 Tax=Oryza glumipatula TaxID=40148 RepID=A0A0E0BNX6_9ORYZ